MSEQLAEEVFHLAAEGVEVPAAPIEEVVARARWQRRRRRRVTAGVVAATLAVVGLATWVGTRQSPDPEPHRFPVARVENPASVAWWANDVLHLQHVAITMPRVEDLVELGDGAVIGDQDGGVVLVDPDGTMTTIGHKAAAAPLVASEHQGWVIWIDPGDRTPQLVVYDTAARKVLTTRVLPHRERRWDGLAQTSYPIAVDGDQIYFKDEDGAWGWVPGEDGLVDVDGLLGVSAATIVKQWGTNTIRIVQPFFSVDYVRSGLGARISPGGEYVLTRAPGGDGGPFGRILVYDTRSGGRLWTGLRPQDVAVAATLGSDDEVTYVVAHRPDQPQGTDFVRLSFTGPYELRTCHLEVHTCSRVTKFPHIGALPVLAR